MRRNAYSSAVFAGGRPLCIQISPGQGRPHQPFWQQKIRHQKTRDIGLPDGEDRILLCVPLVLTQYRSVTDGRTDGFVVAYISFAKLA